MAEVIGFPDAEGLAVAFMKAEYSGRGVAAKVATKRPKTMPAMFTRVSRVGGDPRDLVTDSPMLLFECYGDSTVSAEHLAKVTRALALAAARLRDDVTRVQSVGGLGFNPDPDTNQARYQFTVQWDLRGESI